MDSGVKEFRGVRLTVVFALDVAITSSATTDFVQQETAAGDWMWKRSHQFLVIDRVKSVYSGLKIDEKECSTTGESMDTVLL